MAEWNNHESSEVETLRRTVLAQEETIEIMKKNIRDLQESLQNSYIRISQLKEQRRADHY